MHHRSALACIFGLLVLSSVALLGAMSVRASAEFTVDDTADALDANPGDGLCATSGGACTLRAAVMETNALAGADTVVLPGGIYTLTIPGPGEDMATLGDLDITDELTIAGDGAESTIIDGNGSATLDRVVHIVDSSVEAKVLGVTVRYGGESGAPLGGVHVNGDLTLRDSVVADNVGPGIYLEGEDSTLTMTNCLVINNSSVGIGGGRLTIADSTISGNGNHGIYTHALMMVNSTVSDNVAGGSSDGGGLRTSDGRATLINCTIRDNTSNGEGGGIYNDGTMTIISSTVTGNVALCNNYDHGGGGILSMGSLVIVDSTVSGNEAVGQGGGGIRAQNALHLNNTTISGNKAGTNGGGILALSEGSISLNNVTLTGNTADDGGGIRVIGDAVNVANSIIAGNFDNSPEMNHPDCSGTLISSQGHNLIQDTTGCFIGGNTTGNLTGVNPLLDPLKDNGGPTLTHALLPGSPAIDAGNPAGCTDHLGNPLLTDQRGMPRLWRCDMGAYEVTPRDPHLKTANATAILPGDPLTYTILVENPETIDATGLRLTDTLPTLVTYLDNTLTATNGSYGYADGVVTWTGAVSAGGSVAVRFGVTVSQAASLGTSITNSAAISSAGELITRTATVFVGHQVYLPIVTKGGGLFAITGLTNH